jgi:RNase adaptor protein for sRNA GlmZ degradation
LLIVLYIYGFFFSKKRYQQTSAGLFVTLIYGVQTLEGKEDDHFFAQIIQTAKNAKADIQFVKLECADEELNKRVQSEARKKFSKITGIDVLENLRKKYKVDQKIPLVDSIVIDTTKLCPTEIAYKIKEELKLNR